MNVVPGTHRHNVTARLNAEGKTVNVWSIQLFFDVTAVNAATNWWTCLPPQWGQVIPALSISDM